MDHFGFNFGSSDHTPKNSVGFGTIPDYKQKPLICNSSPLSFFSTVNKIIPNWSTSVSQNKPLVSNVLVTEGMDIDNTSSNNITGSNFTSFINMANNNNPTQPPRRNAHRNARDKNQDFFRNIFEDPKEATEVTSSRIKKKECGNSECDHQDYTQEELTNGDHLVSKIAMTEVNDIEDLITLGRSFHCKKNKFYNQLNLETLFNLVIPLTELRDLVGMQKVKRDIVNQIIFFLQGLNKQTRCNVCMDCSFDRPCKQIDNNDMLHTVITGPPGVGKTELGRIMGHIYRAMGILKKGHMKVVKRSDLIGKYLGHTAAKTQEVIDQAQGGVLFIDEAYSLGNKEGRDSFSKECLDTLNQNLTERRDFLCIIAGYKEALETCFFNYNEGLKRRFSFRYDIDGYTPEELRDIFLIKVKKNGWGFESTSDVSDSADDTQRKRLIHHQLTQFFVANHQYFPNYGGDVETLFLNCKIYHGRRVLLLEQNKKKTLTIYDVEKGFDTYVLDRQHGVGFNGNDRDRMFYVR